MGQWRDKLRVAAAGAAILGLVAPAAAAADPRADLDVRLSAQAPATSSGVAFRVVYKHPDDPNAKPPALTKAAFELPAGTRLDSGALPQCTATDDELQARGPSACPAESRIGAGTFVGITGAGPPADPFVGDIAAFNGPNQIVELVLFQGTSTTAGYDRITIEGSTLVAHPPATPGGPPDGRTVPRSIELNIGARVEGGRPYLTTPAACPGAGRWQSIGRFEFLDGGAASVPAATPCTPGAAAAALRLRVAPRAVRAGDRARLRVRVSSDAAGCSSGVTVTLGRARATTDGAGRAVLRKKLSTAKTVTVRASKPGCGSATAPVHVVATRP
jgi:hypothetical protein